MTRLTILSTSLDLVHLEAVLGFKNQFLTSLNRMRHERCRSFALDDVHCLNSHLPILQAQSCILRGSDQEIQARPKAKH